MNNWGFVGCFGVGVFIGSLLTLAIEHSNPDFFQQDVNKLEKDKTTIVIGWKEENSDLNFWHAGFPGHKHLFILDSKEDYEVASQLIQDDANESVNHLIREVTKKRKESKEKLKELIKKEKQ